MAKSALIVGAGIVGLCTARALVRRGVKVSIVDRASEQDEGCSFGNAGMIVPSHIVPLAAPGMVRTALKMMLRPRGPFFIRPRLDWKFWEWSWLFYRAATAEHVSRAAPILRDLHLASRALYEQLAEESKNEIELVTRGLLMLCKTECALHEEAELAHKAKELGIPAEVCDAKRTAELDPDVRMNVAGSIYFPMDCHLTPGRLMAMLRRTLSEAGVKFLWNTSAIGWRTSGERIDALRTTQGELTADEFVLCGGSWSPAIVRDLKLRIPIQAGKGYSLTLSNPRQLPRICSIFTEARVAVTPMGSRLRFGGTMEIAGLNSKINRSRVRGLIESIPRYYPQFSLDDFTDVPVWSGLRPCSPDGLPYVGRTRAYRNLSIASGHAMMGVSLGPISGELVAQSLSGEPSSIDIRLLNPDRYSCRAAIASQESVRLAVESGMGGPPMVH